MHAVLAGRTDKATSYANKALGLLQQQQQENQFKGRFVFVCVCVCLCVLYERERQRETETERERQRERDRDREKGREGGSEHVAVICGMGLLAFLIKFCTNMSGGWHLPLQQ